jgi:hypothetical protein
VGTSSELKQTLDQYSTDIKGLINIQPKQFDIFTISTMISSLPERKWNAAQAVVNNTIAKKAADQSLKVARAKAGLTASTRKVELELASADDRRAWVDSQDEVQDAEIDAIDAEAELIAAKLAYECLDDLFTAGKRIAQYLVEQDKQTKEFERFSNEGKRG